MYSMEFNGDLFLNIITKDKLLILIDKHLYGYIGL